MFRPGSLRALLRAKLAIGFTTAIVSTWLLVSVFLLFSPTTLRKWRRQCMQTWCQWLCSALGVKVQVRGEVPKQAQFFVCNHLSYLDILVLGSVLPVAFVSRADVARWPLIGVLAQWFDTVFLSREQKRMLPEVNATITARLSDGCALVLFPEGTSTAGSNLLPFRPSLLAPAAELGIPVHATCLHYATHAPDPAASQVVCWWGDAKFAPHVRALLALRHIDATLSFAPSARSHADRKLLAAELERDVTTLFAPVG